MTQGLGIRMIRVPSWGHTNPYCMYIKQDPDRFRHCLSMMKKMAAKCLRINVPTAAHDTRVFQQLMAITPSDFRRRYR